MDIDGVRDEIRKKDIELISLIAERIECAERIALIKNDEGLPIRDPEVEKRVIERYVLEGKARGISEDTMIIIAKALIEECVRAENKVISKE